MTIPLCSSSLCPLPSSTFVGKLLPIRCLVPLTMVLAYLAVCSPFHHSHVRSYQILHVRNDDVQYQSGTRVTFRTRPDPLTVGPNPSRSDPRLGVNEWPVTRPDPTNAKIIHQYVKCNKNTTYMKTIWKLYSTADKQTSRHNLYCLTV